MWRILITSIDKDGTKSGLDLSLIETSLISASRPVIVSGGIGKIDHIVELLRNLKPSGICLSSSLHYNLLNIQKVKNIEEEKIDYVDNYIQILDYGIGNVRSLKILLTK